MRKKKLPSSYHKKGISFLVPLLFFFLLVFILSFIWFHDRTQNKETLQELCNLMADQVSFRLDTWINERLMLSDYLALNWKDQYAKSPQKFQKDVGNLLKIYPGIQAINWIDQNWVIRIVNPYEGNEQALHKDLHSHPEPLVREAIQKAVERRELTCTPVINLLQGGRGFASYRPVFQNDRLTGFINIVFRTDTLIQYCLTNPMIRQHFQIKIFTQQYGTIYQTSDRVFSTEFEKQSYVKIGNQLWVVQVNPKQDFIKQQLAVFRNKYFFLNLFFILIIAILIWNLLLRHLKLKRNEAQFRSLFESANIWIHFLNSDGTIVHANPIFYEQTKLSPEKVIGKNFKDFLNAKSKKIFSNWLANLKTNSEFRSELELKLGGRIAGIIDCSGVVIHDDLTASGNIILYSNNVTDKKRFEQALNESEEKYRQIVEQSHDAIFIYRNRKFLFVNNSLKQLSEYSKDELYEIDILQLIHPKDRAKLARFAQARKKGEFVPNQYEAKIITKTGKIRICEFNVNPISYGGRMAILGTVRDITEEQKARDALKASEKRYRNLYENVPVGLYRIREDGHIMAANPTTLKLLGFNKFSELKKVNFFSFYVDEKSYTLWKNLLRYSEKQQIHETRLRKKDGTIIWVRDTAKVYHDQETGEIYFEGVLEDITEQKKAQDQLIESEKRFKEMANLLPQCVFECNVNFRLTYVNSFATRLTGYSQQEMLNGMKIIEWFPKNQQEKVSHFLQSILNLKNPPSNEFVAVKKDGLVFPVLIFASPILRRGEKIGIRGVIVDISERKNIEMALKESESRYRSVVEQSPDAIVVHENGKVIFANQAALRIYKFKSLDDAIGAPVINFVHPDYVEIVKKRIRDSLTKGSPMPLIREKHIAVDGSEIEVEVAGTVIEYQGRRVFLTIVRDISERLKYQKALQESEVKFKSILTSMIDMVFLFDPNGKLLFFNVPELQELRRQLKQYIGKPIFRILPRSLKLQLKSTIRKLNHGQTVTLEFNVDLNDKRTKWFSTNVSPMIVENQINGFVAVVRDITHRKESELKLSQALSEKEVLLQEVHHRVKNNLQSLFYLIQMNKEQVKDLTSKEIFNNLQNQLRAMSLVYEQLYHSTNLASIFMKDYLQSLVTNVRHSFPNVKDVIISLNVDDVKLNVEKALPCGLIVNELLSNSFKYAFSNGVKKENKISVILKLNKNQLNLVVKDNGIGFTVPKSLNSLKSMGLRLVHLWATHQLGGKINFRTSNGTEVNISFPV